MTATAWRRRWAGLLSVEDIRRLVMGGALRYGADLDVTRYMDGERATYNAKECEVDAEVEGAGGGGDLAGEPHWIKGGGCDDANGEDANGVGTTAGRDNGSGGSTSVDDDAGGSDSSDSNDSSASDAIGMDVGDDGRVDDGDGDGTDDGEGDSNSAGHGRAAPPAWERAGSEAWARFSSAGCSLRLLRPQASSTPLWSLASRLEGHFRCAVGANAYLTPAGTQGFAPHFDDIDAFILQVAGAKRWRVYPPRPDGLDTLPRHSSVDFGLADVAGRAPVVDAVLHPGDVLYLPRGAVHQAVAVAADDAVGVAAVAAGPSLHLTLSTSQLWTWADWLKASFAEAVESAAAEEVALRRTLPRGLLSVAGVAPSSVAATAAAAATTSGRRHGGGGRGGAAPPESVRDAVRSRLRSLLKLVARRYPLDAAVDGLAARFLTERLPPCPVDMAAHAPPPPGWGVDGEGNGGGGGAPIALGARSRTAAASGSAWKPAPRPRRPRVPRWSVAAGGPPRQIATATTATVGAAPATPPATAVTTTMTTMGAGWTPRTACLGTSAPAPPSALPRPALRG